MLQFELQCPRCNSIVDVSLGQNQKKSDFVCPRNGCGNRRMIINFAQCMTSHALASAITDLETRLQKVEAFCLDFDENGEWEFQKENH